ncbi:MAG: DUF933 domain-containing protein [Puniceicoccales bacterium]|nr:DUF933 domain-containing protein [Puniceicoccales bacterium]
MNCENLVKAGSILAAKEAGKYRLEGRDYKVRDGDVIIFRFNNGHAQDCVQRDSGRIPRFAGHRGGVFRR